MPITKHPMKTYGRFCFNDSGEAIPAFTNSMVATGISNASPKARKSFKTNDAEWLRMTHRLRAFLKRALPEIQCNCNPTINAIRTILNVLQLQPHYQNKLPDLLSKITDTEQQIKKFKQVHRKLLDQERELEKVKTKKTILSRSWGQPPCSPDLLNIVFFCFFVFFGFPGLWQVSWSSLPQTS